MGRDKQAGEKLRGHSSGKLEFCSTWQVLLLAAPAIIWLILFKYMPMYGTILAFKDYKFSAGIWGSAWNGLDNFKYLFLSNDGIRIMRNTVLYNVAFLISQHVVSFIVAVMIYDISRPKLVKLYQTSMFLPYFISWIIVGSFFGDILFDYEKGVLNMIRGLFGANAIEWYGTPGAWPAIMIIAHLWKTLGSSTVIYLGAITGIDPGLLEAGTLDGCNWWQRLRHIILPLTLPTVALLMILGIGSLFSSDFGMFYYMTKDSGILYPTTDVIGTYAYRMMKTMGNIGVSSAVSLFQSVMGTILLLIANTAVRRFDRDLALM